MQPIIYREYNKREPIKRTLKNSVFVKLMEDSLKTCTNDEIVDAITIVAGDKGLSPYFPDTLSQIKKILINSIYNN